ncbi:MAG: hypothetical protein OXR62_05775 [Ahrensia sp.]|nr:hypothetical protein [Ahrensia sp.]
MVLMMEAVKAAPFGLDVFDADTRRAVLDVQVYDDTLVALVAPCVPRERITKALDEAWGGDIEVHCASDLAAGGNIWN